MRWWWATWNFTETTEKEINFPKFTPYILYEWWWKKCASQNIPSEELFGLSWDPPPKIGALLSSLVTVVVGMQWKCKFCEITCRLWIFTLFHSNVVKIQHSELCFPQHLRCKNTCKCHWTYGICVKGVPDSYKYAVLYTRPHTVYMYNV